MNSVQACLSPPRSYTYRDLVRLIKSNFSETVTELHNKKLKIRHVAKNSPLFPPPYPEDDPPLPLMYDSPSHVAHNTHHSMHNIAPLLPHHNTTSTSQPQYAHNAHNQQHNTVT